MLSSSVVSLSVFHCLFLFQLWNSNKQMTLLCAFDLSWSAILQCKIWYMLSKATTLSHDEKNVRASEKPMRWKVRQRVTRTIRRILCQFAAGTNKKAEMLYFQRKKNNNNQWYFTRCTIHINIDCTLNSKLSNWMIYQMGGNTPSEFYYCIRKWVQGDYGAKNTERVLRKPINIFLRNRQKTTTMKNDTQNVQWIELIQ